MHFKNNQLKLSFGSYVSLKWSLKAADNINPVSIKQLPLYLQYIEMWSGNFKLREVLLNVITLGQTIYNNYKQVITLSKLNISMAVCKNAKCKSWKY